MLTGQYAPPGIRDAFLGALDEPSSSEAVRLAWGLTTCRNPLPGLACAKLNLPIGSSYGEAAKRVLNEHSLTSRVATPGAPSEDA
jgi:hypothetical protein